MPVVQGSWRRMFLRSGGGGDPAPWGPPPAAAGTASVVGFLVVLEFTSGLLQGWLPPLLPGILQQYGTTAAELNWVSAVYLLSSTVCVPLMSRLGDLYGHRRLLVVAAVLVAIGSVLVAVAPTFGILLLGRAVQGPLGAFLPLEFAIVREGAERANQRHSAFAKRRPSAARECGERAGAERSGRAIGLLVGALAVGGSLGLLLAGLTRQYLSLSATLWVPAVLTILAVPVAALLVPETTVRTSGRVDWAGAGLLGLGLALLLVAVGNSGPWGWSDVRTLGGIVAGVAALTAWVAVERRVRHPFVDLSLVVRRGRGVPLLAGFLIGAELFGSQAAVALFLGLPAATGFGLGLAPGQLGLVLLAFSAAAFVGTVLAPRLAERIGSRTTLVSGALLTAAGYVLTALAHGSVGAFLVWQILVGAGNGLVLAALSAHVVAHAPVDAVGISAGLFNTARSVGGAASGAAFAAVMAALSVRLPGVPRAITSEAGYVTVWLVCAALALGVVGLATRLRRDPVDRVP
jgi:MFS family permease